MSTKKIANSTFWQIGSQATTALLSILTVKFVAMGLSKELAGIYNSAYGYLQLFGILADFGLYAVAVRELAKVKDQEKVLGSLLILRFIILILSLGAALFIAWILPHWRGTPLPTSIAIAAFVPFFTLLAGILRTIFQVHYRMQYVAFAEILQRSITVILIGAIIFFGTRQSTNVETLFLFLLFGGVGACVLFLISFLFGRKIIRIRPHFDLKMLRKLFLRAAPFGVAYVCLALYRQMDTTLIALLRPDFEIQNAYYGFVLRMGDIAFIVPTFLLNSALPVLSERDGRGEDTKKLLGKILFILLLLGITALLFSLLWSRPIMHLLTTESYLSSPEHPGADTALRLLALPMLLNSIILYGFYVLLIRHKWKPLIKTLSFGAILSLSLNLLLIPKYGFVGAATTSIIIHTLLAGILFIQSKNIMPLALPFTAILQIVFYAVLLATVLLLLRPFLFSPLWTLVGLMVAGGSIALIARIIGLHKTLR